MRERVLAEERRVGRDDRVAQQVGAERRLAADLESCREEPQDVAGPPGGLALDLDGQQLAVGPGQDDRAVGRQLAGEAPVRVEGELVDDGVAGVQPSRRPRPSRPRSPKKTGPTILSDSCWPIWTGWSVTSTVAAGARREVAELGDGAAEDDGRLEERLVRGVGDRALQAAVLEPEVGLDERDRDRGLGADVRSEPKPTARSRTRAGSPWRTSSVAAVPSPPRKSPLIGRGEQRAARDAELVGAARRREHAEVDWASPSVVPGAPRTMATSLTMRSLPRSSEPKPYAPAANATIRAGIVTHAHSRLSSRRRTR